MTWHASCKRSTVQNSALLAVITTFRASFSNAFTELVGTLFLISTFPACAFAPTRILDLEDFENRFDAERLTFVTLLLKSPLPWQAASLGNTSTNSLTVDATDAFAAWKHSII